MRASGVQVPDSSSRASLLVELDRVPVANGGNPMLFVKSVNAKEGNVPW